MAPVVQQKAGGGAAFNPLLNAGGSSACRLPWIRVVCCHEMTQCILALERHWLLWWWRYTFPTPWQLMALIQDKLGPLLVATWETQMVPQSAAVPWLSNTALEPCYKFFAPPQRKHSTTLHHTYYTYTNQSVLHCMVQCLSFILTDLNS